jgi:hypothetical protein
VISLRNKFQALLKRCVRFFKFAAAGGVVLAAIAFSPAPIEGNWLSESTGCLCGGHSFIRFEHGKILHITEDGDPPYWFGNNERVGWGKYRIVTSFDGTGAVVNACCLFVRPKEPLQIISRDPSVLKCRRILRRPENEWVNDASCFCLSVRNVKGDTVYNFGDKEKHLAQLETMLTRLMRWRTLVNTSIDVYTLSNACPSNILNVIAFNGFGSVTHTNQAWVKDVHKNNLVVRARDGKTSYWVNRQPRKVENLAPLFAVPETERCAWWTPVSAVFVPAEGVPEPLQQILSDTGYTGAVFTNHPWCAASDPQGVAVVVGEGDAGPLIWLCGKTYTPKEFETAMCARKNCRAELNMPLVVYAENAVVPPDLAAMLARVGCAYETRSVELLRRSK